MIAGLLPTTPNRLPNSWLYGLEGLAALEAAFSRGLGADNSGLNPGGVTPIVISCSGGGGCTTNQPVSSTPWGTLPCDPNLVNQGLTCNVDASGNVTYTDANGNTYPASAFSSGGGATGPTPVVGPQPTSGGGGTQPGNSVPVGVSTTGTGTGTTGTGTGNQPPSPVKSPNWMLLALLLVGGLVVIKGMA